MKKMKFKILALFMMIILVGIGCSAVFAEEVEVLKVSDLYKLRESTTEPGEVIFVITSNGNVESDKELGYISKYSYRQKVILAKTFFVDGVEYIRYSDWVDGYFDSIYGRNDIYSYSDLEQLKRFAGLWYDKMNSFEYTPNRGTGKSTFINLVSSNLGDEGKLRKYLNSSSYSSGEKGLKIIESFGMRDGLVNVILDDSGEIIKFINSLNRAILPANWSPGNISNQIKNLSNLWVANREDSTNAELKNRYLNYYNSQKLVIDSAQITTQPVSPSIPDGSTEYTNTIGNFWQGAFDWFGGVNTSGNNGVTSGFMKGATHIIKIIGNMIFIVVTAILGVKYIWGSADAKHDVKGSLFSLVLAAVVFYGWDIISNILKGVTDNVVSNSMQSSAIVIYSYILYFVNIAAIAGIIFLGVKYLMASAEGKSQLKMKMGPAFLGIIMVYATISFLNTILSIFLG